MFDIYMYEYKKHTLIIIYRIDAVMQITLNNSLLNYQCNV